MKVVDASVVAILLNREPKLRKSQEILESDVCIAPPLIVSEALNTIWKRVHRKQLDSSLAIQLSKTFVENLPVLIETITGKIWTETIKIAVENDITVYDALYIALARVRGVPLVSADKKQLLAAKNSGIEIIEL